jgi:hypothetical protein
MTKFSVNDRVRISEEFFWAKGATGTITEPPPEVVVLSGPWDSNLTRQERTALGVRKIYWVWFDVPQLDADGDGPYRGGSIDETAMSRISS